VENVKKTLGNLKKRLPTLLFLMCTPFSTLASFQASLQKGESLALQGKFNEAIETLSPLAAKNDSHALYLMAVIYLSPNFNYFNAQKGVAFLEKAVFQNYAPALDELAGLYLAGEGVKKDEAKALHYYIQASHIGYGPSQFNCGIMYKNGHGTEKNFVKSYLYLTLASLNYKDLGEVTLNAAQYRDGLVPFLSSKQRQDVSRQINALVLPEKSTKSKVKSKRITS
jgi:TPR repeat protein